MRRQTRFRILPLILLFAIGSVWGQSEPASGSAKFYFVLLQRPANAPQLSKEAGEKLQDAHMANIRKLHAEHKLYVAGPFLDDTTLRGIFVFKADSAEQVKEWTATDPAVQAGRLALEVHGPWQLRDENAIHYPEATEGLEQYAMALMRAGDQWNGEIPADLLGAHGRFLRQMVEQGKFAVVGRFDSGDLKGVTICRVSTDEATKLVNEDPLVKAGWLKPEIHPWATGKGVLAPGLPLP